MAENYVLLETIELTQSAASVTFDNIPQSGYTDLKLFVSTRTNTITGAWDNVYITFNGSSSGYSQRILYGNGSIVQSDTGSSTNIRTVYSNTATQGDNYFSSNEVYIPNYTSSNYKTASMESAVEQNSTNGHLSIASALWTNTSAITSITLAPSAYTFAAGCTFSLYGIAATGTTPTVAPNATGGNIVANDGTYWYHAFLTSGTFTPQTALTCDYLVVAGGGSGGGQLGGGGGAGGLRSTVTATGGGGSLESALSLSLNTSYTVTVGAGGAGVNTISTGNNGSNSVFATITSIGGGGGGKNSDPTTGVGNSGGSGGGNGEGTLTTNIGTVNQGYKGGSAYDPGQAYGAGGGGGSGEAGWGGTNASGGYGGNGVAIPTFAAATNTGVSNYYAGGGGGSAWSSYSRGLGGSGGGGRGGIWDAGDGTAGTANTGGGGGGAASNSGLSPAGGSGIVIIRYAM